MAPKKAIAPSSRNVQYPRQNTWGREGLGQYIVIPETFSGHAIVRYTDKFVVVRDLYPKGDIHLLIMPRDPKISTLIPQDALEDPVFLEECKEELKVVRHMVGEELRRRYGQYSAQEQLRIAAMASEDPPEELPPGRDWEKDIIEGVHSRPSMKHLHIHVVSGDMTGASMKDRDAYNKFRTNELISLQDFPLAREDIRTPQGVPAIHRPYKSVSSSRRAPSARGSCSQSAQCLSFVGQRWLIQKQGVS